MSLRLSEDSRHNSAQCSDSLQDTRSPTEPEKQIRMAAGIASCVTALFCFDQVTELEPVPSCPLSSLRLFFASFMSPVFTG